jgi:hypothetical protein
VLVELANETVAAAQQSAVCFSVRCRIRKVRTANRIVRSGEASMSVCGFYRCSIDDKAEQQKREDARKRTVRPD